MDKNTRKLLKLEEEFEFPENWLTQDVQHHIKYHIIHASWERKIEKCHHCGHNQLIRYGNYLRKIKLLPVYENPTKLHLKTRRYQCTFRHKTMTCETPIVKKYCHIAIAVYQKALLPLSKSVTKKHIAQELAVSDASVHRVMQQAVISCKQTYSYLPKVLCIDEFKALKTSYSKMNFIYVDGESGEIIDILSTRQCRYLLSHFLKYSRKQRLNVR